MPVEASRVDDLIARLRELPSGDRTAVLARMPLEKRYVVEKMLRNARVPTNGGEEEAPVAGKRFAHYSANLARLLTAIDAGEPPNSSNGQQPTAATCNALLACAEEIQKQMDRDAPVLPVPFFDSVRALIFGTGSKT